jgi:mannose-1-phosphate guanylyltransferase
MLNGDVLTDIDLTAQLRQHESTGARATLALIGVADPSAYGLVRRDGLAVREFLEKPSPDEIDTNLVNAGAYILERDILDDMAQAGTRISIEREVFPHLVGHGLYGFEASGYWMDIGTPERYLQATYEILESGVQTEIGRAVAQAGGVLTQGDGAGVQGVVHGPAVLGTGCRVAPSAVIGSRTVLGRDVSVGEGAHIESSVLLDGAYVGSGSRVVSSIIGPGARIGDNCRVEGRVMLGENVSIGSDNTLMGGIRVFPGTQLGDAAVAF